MLVITRKARQRIKIGEDVWVEIIKHDKGKFQIGIIAPKHVQILREELCNKKGDDK